MRTTKRKLGMILTIQVVLVCFFSMGNTEDVNVAGDWMGARDRKEKAE